MTRKWKISFYSFLFMLIFFSSFWIYNTYENSASNSNAVLIENETFKETINSKETRAKLISFLKNNKIEFEDYYKDEHYVVNFNSFSVEYDKYGIKIK